jgi:HlyD family secretion protein
MPMQGNSVNPIAQPAAEGKAVVARVWVLKGGKPVPITFMRGLQNARYAEVVGGDLKDGDQIIVGATESQNGTQAAQNPFGPQRMMMGGGGRGR